MTLALAVYLFLQKHLLKTSALDKAKTLISGLQTVGEEYCHLLQVDGAKLKIPDAKVM